MKMRVIISGIFLMLISGLWGCDWVDYFNVSDNDVFQETEATILYTGEPAVDGCDWVVVINEKSYHPQNLPDEFQEENLNVQIRYKLTDEDFVCGFSSIPEIFIHSIERLDQDLVTGTVMDYTGLDGCGFVIELDNGEKLEPAQVVPEYTFVDGRRVKLSYTPLDGMGSICMVGTIVRIDYIENIGCTPLTRLDTGDDASEFVRDPFEVNQVEINGNCLKINVSYSGGCAEHEFKLLWYPNRCGTPPEMLELVHNANGDLCEAYPSETVSFDLSQLCNGNKNNVEFTLRAGDYSQTFTYKRTD